MKSSLLDQTLPVHVATTGASKLLLRKHLAVFAMCLVTQVLSVTPTHAQSLGAVRLAPLPQVGEAPFHPAVSPEGRSASDFLERSIAFPSDQTEQDRRQSMIGLLEGMPKRSRQQFDRWLGALDHALSDYQGAAIWRHDRHSRSLVRLTLFNHGNPIDSYFLLSPSGVVPITVPARFTQQPNQDLVKVSDQDQDGQLELWWANRHDVRAVIRSDTECDGGDESDLERDVFCRKVPGQTVQAEQSCNRMLIGRVLGPTLGIVDWSSASEDPRRVVNLVCKRHPLHAGQILVALFHEIPGSYGPYDVRPYGFTFAVLDLKDRRVIRLHQSTLEEDGGTNVSGGNLKIDTGRYWLKKGTRALGVRMDIARMPSAPDSYANHFLTLFVEEGTGLRPVLEGFPLYRWQIRRNGDCVDRQWANEERGDQVCEDESEYLRLALGAARPGGWRDLVVVVAGEGEDRGSSSARRATLTYTNGRYTGSASDGWWP